MTTPVRRRSRSRGGTRTFSTVFVLPRRQVALLDLLSVHVRMRQRQTLTRSDIITAIVEAARLRHTGADAMIELLDAAAKR